MFLPSERLRKAASYLTGLSVLFLATHGLVAGELGGIAEPGLVLMVYTAEPGSASAERLRLLASWGASENTSTEVHQNTS